MLKHSFNSEDRPVAKYVQDLELAYIIQRYREIHDALHVLLGYDTSVSEELAVKWYEMSTLGLPSAALASFFGPANLLYTSLASRDTSELKLLNTVYLPHVLGCAKKKDSDFFMNIYFEKEFETDIDEMRERLGIVQLSEW